MVFKKFVFLFLFYQSFTETIFLKNVVDGSMCNIDYGDDYEDYEDYEDYYDFDELEELAIESSEHLRDLRLTLDTNQDEIHRYVSFSYQEWEFEYPKHIREFAQVLLDQELSMLRATTLNGVNGLLVQFVSSESYDPNFFDRIRTKIIKFFDLNNNVIVSRKMFRNQSNAFANENGVRFAWDNTDLKILEKNVDRIRFGDGLEEMSANEGLLRMKEMVVNAIELFGDDSDDLLIASPLAIFKKLSSSDEKKTTGYLKAMAKLFKKFREIEKYNKKQQKKEKKIKMVTSIKETKLEEYSSDDKKQPQIMKTPVLKKESRGNDLKISSIFEGNFIFRLFCAAICCVIKRAFPNCLKIVTKIMNKFINKLLKFQHGNLNDDDKVVKVDKPFTETSCTKISKQIPQKTLSENKQDDFVETVLQNKDFGGQVDQSKTSSGTSDTDGVVTDFKSLCWNCSKTDVRLFKCSGCRKARYCDTICIGQDWPKHGSYCIKVQNRKSKKN